MFTNLASGQRRLAFYGLGVIALTICGLSLMSAQTAPQQGANAAQPHGATADEPTLRAYDVHGEDPVQAAARLQLQLPKDAGVSVSPDARTGRVYIMAPPATHSMIAKLIENKSKDGTNTDAAKTNSSNVASTANDKGPRGEQTIGLKNITSKQFEESLTKLIGRQLPVTTDESGNVATYTLSTKGSTPTLITVYRANDQIVIGGTTNLLSAWTKLVGALDRPFVANEKESSGIVPVRNPDAVSNGSIQKAMSLIGQQVSTTDRNTTTSRPVSMLFQPREEGRAQAPGQAGPLAPNAQPMNPGQNQQLGNVLQGAEGVDASLSLIGPVQIEYIEALDIIVIKGHPKDVETVTKIIADIEKASVQTVPDVRVYNLKNVDSQAMANLVRPLFDQFLSARQGRITITSLVKPNALLLIGRKESVDTVVSLIEKLDEEVTGDSQFEIFPLKHISATAAIETVKGFLTGTISQPTDAVTATPPTPSTTSVVAPGLGTRATVTADYRSNVLIVRASKRDIEEVRALIKKIDVTTSSLVTTLRVITLKNSLAAEVAPVLQGAITGQSTTTRNQGNQNQGQNFGPFQNQGQNQNQGGGNSQQQQARSTMLELLTYDAQGRKMLQSGGILSDVRITPDAGSNSLVISAPAESMPLIEALIESLDKPATEKALIKVFMVKNGDASSLVTMLQSLFGQQATGGNQRQGGGGGIINFGGLGLGDGSSDSPLVSLNFSVDQRTNSIIVKGSEGDIGVIEAILYKLDGSPVRQRENIVVRLKNTRAMDVANTINSLQNNQRTLQQNLATNTVSPFEQFEKEVIVVAEVVTNSLIISATPRYFNEIKSIIDEIDRRPPMVMVQVLIAEVVLNNFDEFGVELGLQDSVLFDRSILTNPQYQPTTTTAPNGVQTTTNTLITANNTPGYNFNDTTIPLGNSGASSALAQSARIGGQGLTNFAVGRQNDALGFGGLVLSASSESLSVLLRALKQNRRLEVLSRPQIQTLDNQPAYIQVGQKVPFIRTVNASQTVIGQTTNTVEFEQVGLILGVTPRVSPDGMVVLEVDAERSEVGLEAEGTALFTSGTGQVIRQPRINLTVASTTVSAANGQTVVLGGLITKNRQDTSRRAPFLSDIPVIGNLFRYDSSSVVRTELLIIMTPRVVRTQQDIEIVKQVEANRMSWCLSDVIRLHGPSGLRNRKDEWADHETLVIYPDYDPTAELKAPADGAANPNAGQQIPGTDDVLPPGVLPPGAKIINSAPSNPPPAPNAAPSSRNTTPGNRSAGSNAPNLIDNKQGPTLAPSNYSQSQSGLYQSNMQPAQIPPSNVSYPNVQQGNVQNAAYFQQPLMQSNMNNVQSNVIQASMNQPVQQQNTQTANMTTNVTQNSESQSGAPQGLFQAILPSTR